MPDIPKRYWKSSLILDSVLLPEMRQKFDAGEDPLDAEEQSQQRNPFQHFHHGGHPFGGGGGGGGPFQFKFHFN